jgi:hypothetical protein
MTFPPAHQLYITYLSTQISNSEITVTFFLFSGEYSGRRKKGGPGDTLPSEGGTGEPAFTFAMYIIPSPFLPLLQG